MEFVKADKGMGLDAIKTDEEAIALGQRMLACSNPV